MMRSLKITGLALVAMFAMTAVAASAASAATFHSESTPTILTGEQESKNIFETNTGVKVECSTAHFEGTVVGTSVASVTVHPTYGSCLFGSEAATVTTTGCNYILSAEATSGNVQIECEGTNKISVATSACTLTIGAQTPGGSATYTNQGTGAGRSILVSANSTGITFTKDGNALLCAFAGSTGKYTGTVLTKGYKDASGVKGAQQGIWRE
jgi:hypothetical protein